MGQVTTAKPDVSLSGIGKSFRTREFRLLLFAVVANFEILFYIRRHYPQTVDWPAIVGVVFNALWIGFAVAVALNLLRTLFGGAVEDLEAKDASKAQQEAHLEAETRIAADQPAWDVARNTLNEYWQRNLSQNALIYWASIGAITAGFLVSLYAVSRSTQNDLSGPILTAAIGALTQFIGATFLVLYRSTVSQAAQFSLTLERINSVGMAWYIAESLKANPTLKDTTKARVALQVLQQNPSAGVLADGVPAEQADRV